MTSARISQVDPRLDSKPWGGRKLEQYGLDLPADEPIGEALVTAGDAVITAGDGEGQTLQQVIDADPEARLGARALKAVSGKQCFPLLAKLIDAAENLSIQVHPDDRRAETLGKLGKTEAWHILAADDGGVIYVGLNDGVGLDEFFADAKKLDGTSSKHLKAVRAEPGRTILLPAGTVHALGAGVMVYEIQQPSDVTYRLDDWGRVDKQGNPREMHLEQGYEATKIDLRPEMIDPIALGDGTELLAACRYFALSKTVVTPSIARDFVCAESPQVLTLLSGEATLSSGDTSFGLTAGQSAVVWPAESGATMRADQESTVLRAWVPDLRHDIADPAQMTGASGDAIRRLAGLTGDLDASVW